MKKAYIVTIISVISLFFISCDYLSNGNGSSNVMIDLGGSRAVGYPPYNFDSYTVTVTAPDMQMIQKTVSASARYINLYIPAGDDRVIRLDANLSPTDRPLNREHVLSFAGEQKVNLRPGIIVRLKFHMEAGMCRLLVQSPSGNATFRQIDGMSLASNSSNPIYNFVNDYDADGTGRIFFVNGASTITYYDDIVTPNGPNGSFAAGTPTNVIAVDTILNRIYTFGTATGIYQLNSVPFTSTNTAFTPGTPISYSVPVEMRYNMLAIDYRDGYIYAVGPNGIINGNNPEYSLFRYQPGASTVQQTENIHMTNPKDILVKSDYIYVTNYPRNINDSNPDTPGNYASIEVFDRDTLAHIGSFGTRLPYIPAAQPPVAQNNTPGYFYGPHHFIATTNRKIYIIDDGAGTDHGQNRIIAFDSVFDWSGWEILRTEDLEGGSGPLLEYYN